MKHDSANPTKKQKKNLNVAPAMFTPVIAPVAQTDLDKAMTQTRELIAKNTEHEISGKPSLHNLGRTSTSAVGKVKGMEKWGDKWSPDDLRILSDCVAQKLNYGIIAMTLKKSRVAVYAKATSTGLVAVGTRYTPVPMTQEQTNAVKLWESQFTQDKVAKVGLNLAPEPEPAKVAKVKAQKVAKVAPAKVAPVAKVAKK